MLNTATFPYPADTTLITWGEHTDSLTLLQSAPIISDSVSQLDRSIPGFDPSLAQTPGWYFYLLFILLAGLAVSRLYFKDIVGHSLASAFRFNITVNRYKDNSQVQRQIDNILYINYFMSFGFFLFSMETEYEFFPYNITGFPLFMLNAGFLFLFFLLRILLLNLTGHLFNRLKLFREYIYHSFTFNKLLGLLILPLNFAVSYTIPPIRDILIFLSVGLLALILVLKIIRGIEFSFKRHVFSFYLFLYLCALEMVPILLIYKWVTTTL